MVNIANFRCSEINDEDQEDTSYGEAMWGQ